MKGSEAAEGEGAAKMASASSGPSAVGVSSVDPGVSSGASSSGNLGEGGRGLTTIVRWEQERDLGGHL